VSALLLDTHAFLWWVQDDPSLSERARTAIADPANSCLISVASGWELAIKSSLGKIRLPHAIDRFFAEQLPANRFGLLPIEIRHLSRVESLPFHHRDPFDRMLAAQALEDNLAVVSADAVFRTYRVKRIW
jgi:PIN domain nuclease of toxin-antitoxin system